MPSVRDYYASRRPKARLDCPPPWHGRTHLPTEESLGARKGERRGETKGGQREDRGRTYDRGGRREMENICVSLGCGGGEGKGREGTIQYLLP